MIIVSKGEVWLADLGQTVGSEQFGLRPVIIFQNNTINKYTSTILCIPLTTNLERSKLPSCLKIMKGDGVLNDSVALCHQLRALDKGRLRNKLGCLSNSTIKSIEKLVLFTMGVSLTD
jgi:mRNA interferase MazF